MKFIKHDRFLDVCVQITKEHHFNRNGESFTRVDGWYWNLGVNGEAFNIGEMANLEISEKERKNWKISDVRVNPRITQTDSLRDTFNGYY